MAEVKYSWINLDICIAKCSSYEDILIDVQTLVEHDIRMLVSVYNHKFNIILKSDKVDTIRHYMFALEKYPEITEWELSQLISLVVYESKHERKLAFWFGNSSIEEAFIKAINKPQEYSFIYPPEYIDICKACKQGHCITKYVCHTTGVENAKQIFESGKILSYAKTKNLSLNQIAKEPINFAGDPPDFFQYVMFNWGNCFLGDRVVTERKLGRMIFEEDLKKFYSPDVKFYFKYDELINNKNAVFDGYHPIKIKDSVSLYDNFMLCAIPVEYKETMKNTIPRDLRNKIIYVDRELCTNIWDWADRAYKAMIEFI